MSAAEFLPPTVDRSSLIAHFLSEQQQLTAVEQFARDHDHGGVPAQAKYYAKLLPVSAPGPGQQYAFEVDLDACSGCKACVTACHTLNGLDEDETWRDVGLLHGGGTGLPHRRVGFQPAREDDADLPVLQHVTSACHHCLDPACLNVCPVGAYEKDPLTGIVKHLDDQCFGCQYCILACPYDVPKYNKQRGIVRKCDMCSSRLAVGEAPACVQACPHEAIRITLVTQQEVIENSETNLFLPGAPEPQYTLPTTSYKTRRVLPRNLLPADYYSVKPEHAHWPLVLMLVLTQLSVGAFLVELVLNLFLEERSLASVRPVHSAGALFFGLLALGASVLHLGRPLYAYRAVLGLRTSWLSREILAFGLFAILSTIYAASPKVAGTLRVPSAAAPETLPIHSFAGGASAKPLESLVERILNPFYLGGAVVATGLGGVFCSVMIYQCTRRVFWNGVATGVKFLLTALILGIATSLVTTMAIAVATSEPSVRQALLETGGILCRGLIAATSAKLLFESAVFRHLRNKQNTPLKRTAMLMTGELTSATTARFGCGFLGGIWLPGMLLLGNSLSAGADGNPNAILLVATVLALFAACLAGELLERYLFFTAVVAPKMPGGLAP